MNLKEYLQAKNHPISHAIKQYFPGAKMIDPNTKEFQAMDYAGNIGFDYIDTLKSDKFSDLTQEEYMTFIECVITAYQDKMRTTEEILNDEIPY